MYALTVVADDWLHKGLHASVFHQRQLPLDISATESVEDKQL